MNANVATGKTEIPEPNITRFLFADTRMAPVWLLLRLCWVTSGCCTPGAS